MHAPEVVAVEGADGLELAVLRGRGQVHAGARATVHDREKFHPLWRVVGKVVRKKHVDADPFQPLEHDAGPGLGTLQELVEHGRPAQGQVERLRHFPGRAETLAGTDLGAEELAQAIDLARVQIGLRAVVRVRPVGIPVEIPVEIGIPVAAHFETGTVAGAPGGLEGVKGFDRLDDLVVFAGAAGFISLAGLEVLEVLEVVEVVPVLAPVGPVQVKVVAVRVDDHRSLRFRHGVMVKKESDLRIRNFFVCQ